MDSVVSNWKITYDKAGTPLVVVDFGQEIGDEFELPCSQTVQQNPKLRARSMNNFGRGNVASGLSITVFYELANDAAARNWMQAFVAAFRALETKILTIEVQGGDTYAYPNAVIISCPPKMVTDRSDKGVVMVTWTIATGLPSKV